MNSNKENRHKTGFNRLVAPLMEIFGLSWGLALTTVVFLVVVLGLTVFWFFHSAPPSTLTMTTGPVGSVSESNAIKYSNFLAKVHVTLKILPSQGSLENLQRLDDPNFKVDVGFIQGGVTNGIDGEGNSTNKLVSLGSISYQPLLIFYRSSNSLSLLSDLKGKQLAIGPVGSGTRSLALALFALNGIEPGGTTKFLDWDADEATQALLQNKVDAAFMMGDSASVTVMRQLLHTPDVRLLDLAQAEGYSRRVPYLNKLDLPQGTFDFGNRIPPQDVRLIGPTVELIARPSLHPALSDLLLDAARHVHGPAGIFRRQGEFPAPQEHDFPISSEAQRYYTSGKTFLYRSLPFWLAGLVNRVLVALVPVVVLLIPGLKIIPAAFKWRIKLKFYRWYRALLNVERQLTGPLTPAKRKELLAEIDGIEKGVNKMKVPPSFAGDFYGLRGNVEFVRNMLTENAG